MLMATGLLMTYLAVASETKTFWFRFESFWVAAIQRRHHLFCPGICLAGALADPPQPDPAIYYSSV